MTKRVDSSVQILRRDGEWRRGVVRAIGPTYATIDVYVVDRWVRDMYHHDTLEAMQALHEATDAVAKARDEVVDAAKEWVCSPHPNRHVSDAVHVLFEAERVEAEARARLEALR